VIGKPTEKLNEHSKSFAAHKMQLSRPP
jgi:hypothetical protein